MMYLTKTGPSFDARPRSQGMNVRLVKDVEAPTGMPSINNSQLIIHNYAPRKVLINGKFYIMQDGKLFNAQGARIR